MTGYDLKGLVEAEVISQDGKHDKKVNSITEAGRAALIAWLSEPFQMHCQLEAQRTRLKRYQQETRRHIQETTQIPGLARRGVLRELVRQYGDQQTITSIQWLEEAIQVVEEKL
jgi:DNA-binding PadR family transcriptional regulator